LAMANICIVATTRCNLSCPDCLARGHDDRELDMVDMAAISLYHRQRCIFPRIAITGGEPTLWPHLTDAIDLFTSTGIAKSIKVISNGRGCNAWDYGNADVVQVSNYGCINQADIVRLKAQMGKRLRIANPTHVQPEAVETVDCSSKHHTYYAGQVYPCAAAWRQVGAVGRPIGEEPGEIDPQWCRTCEHNRDALPASPTIIELRILDSQIHRQIRLPRMASLRRRYRAWLNKPEELYNGEPG